MEAKNQNRPVLRVAAEIRTKKQSKRIHTKKFLAEKNVLLFFTFIVDIIADVQIKLLDIN